MAQMILGLGGCLRLPTAKSAMSTAKTRKFLMMMMAESVA